MTEQLIPLTATDADVAAVMGRDLHEFLESGEQYVTWFKRMISYGFTDGVDYVHKNKKIERPAPLPPAVKTDHILTLDMAKEISMIQRTDRGKQARQYFIECEKRAKQAPAIPQNYSEALRAAADAADRAAVLEAKAVEDAPKVAYHDTYIAESDQLSFRSVASTIGITEKQLREELIDRKWIYRETSSRMSRKAGGVVPQYRYSEYADKKPYFIRRQNHDAPRFRGEVDHTLKITPAGAHAIARAMRRWGIDGDLQDELPLIVSDETIDHS